MLLHDYWPSVRLIGTNAISTRTGARVGVITTVGHRDAIHIARGMSKWGGLPDAEIKHMAAPRKPDPIVPKTMIEEVRERINCDGTTVCSLNTEDVRQATEQGYWARSLCINLELYL